MALEKSCVKQNSLIQHEEKCVLVKEVRNGNFLKMHVSEIRVKQIRVNQGLGVVNICLRPFKNAGVTIVWYPSIQKKSYP